MAQSKQEIADQLSQAIFGKSWRHLSLDERHFAYLHTRWYYAYRKQIADAARKAMNSKKLDGKDYWLIFDWYLNRVPPNVVLAAIAECEKWARENSKGIYSLYYFRKAVTRHFEKHRKDNFEWGRFEDPDLDWKYKTYIQWTKGGWENWYFDSFEGPNRHYGMKRER